MRQVCLHMMLMVVFTQVSAQSDSSKSLPDVMVHAKLKKYASSINSIAIDSALLTQQANASVAQLLQQQSGAFVRMYGASSLSVASIRGSSASQVNLLWNGLPINQYSNAQTDLSLLPAFLFDEVQVHMGGNASAWQSGDVGGSIILLNKAKFEKASRVKLIGTIGSFGLWQGNLGVLISNEKYVARSKVHYSSNENNYPFLNPLSATKEYTRLQNSRTKQVAIQQEFSYKINNRHSVDAVLWFQKVDRLLPPTMFQAVSKEQQIDEHIRIKVEHQCRQNKFQWYNRVAAANEFLNYINPVINVSSKYFTNYANAESELHYSIKNNLSLFGSVGANIAQMNTDNYAPDRVTQNRIFARVSTQFSKQNFGTTGGIKIETADGKLLPLVYNLTAYYLASKTVKVSANMQRNYRLPSFNDLYWRNGGNINLKPEQGYSTELAVQYCKNSFDVHAGAYYRNTTNWIAWQPNAVGQWLAKNIDDVRSRGIEIKGAYSMKLSQHFSTKYIVRYDYCRASFENNAMPSSKSLQLIYVPMHKSSSDLELIYKKIQLNYNLLYLGKRFTSADNIDFLPSVWVQNISAGTFFANFERKLSVNASINNVFAQQYQVVSGRPMPLRNYVLSLSLDLSKSNNKTTIDDNQFK
jgi:vitamin B12 transporter